MDRRVDLTDAAFEDLERIADFTLDRELARSNGDIALADRVVDAILVGLSRLGRASFTCRMGSDGLDPGLREAVIEFGGTGFVALFKVLDEERLRVLAIRHQREEGYKE